MQTLWSDPCCLFGLLMGGVLVVKWMSVAICRRLRGTRACAEEDAS